MSIKRSDLIIIGAGPGGYETAAAAARQGLKVTLIEKSDLGGTCLNRGCIPTKALCASASRILALQDAAAFGVEISQWKADFAAAAARMRQVVSGLREGVAMELSKVEIVSGTARLASTGPSVWVGEDRYMADRLIISTGSVPSLLPIPGAHLAMTSDTLLALDTLPPSIAVIGGGVIGMEFASILAAFGVEVTVLEFCKEILPPFDRDVAKRLRSLMSRRGIRIVTDARVTSIAEAAGSTVEVAYEAKGKAQSLAASAVLMAVGRKACLPEGLAEAGIKVDHRGFIMVDDDFRTSREHIYAIGDVNGRCMLAHAASAQGRSVLGEDVNLSVIPSALFTEPEAAMAGLTEEQCRERGLHYRVSRSLYAANGKAAAMGETQGFVKLISQYNGGAILGCHILGAHAADLIQEVATAMSSSLTVRDLAAAVHTHPSLSEAVWHAACASAPVGV